MDDLALIYTGDGAFWPGVPAKSLTANEVKLYGGQQALINTGLYALPKPEKKTAKAKEVNNASSE